MVNGKDIKICGQKWLPSPTSYCVQSPIKILMANTKICDLIDEMRKEWKVELIEKVFHIMKLS